MSDEEWSKETIVIDGKHYFHKSGVPQEGDMFLDDYMGGVMASGPERTSEMPRVLLKPAKPEHPRGNEFFGADAAEGLSSPNRNSSILKRQFESGIIATRLLHDGRSGHWTPELKEKVRDYFLAREEGLEWPEGLL